MHQSVVEYDVVPAALTAVADVAAGEGHARAWSGPHDASATEQATRGGSWPAYVRAAGIATSLVVVWAGLCVI